MAEIPADEQPKTYRVIYPCPACNREGTLGSPEDHGRILLAEYELNENGIPTETTLRIPVRAFFCNSCGYIALFNAAGEPGMGVPSPNAN